MAIRALFAFVVLATASFTHGFPGGAPASTCSSMMPRHLARAQDHSYNPPPYRITINDGVDTYEPNQRIDLTLQSIDSSILAKGFILQARTLSDDTPVGKFVEAHRGTKIICDDKAVTQYRTWQVTKTRYRISWQAPDSVVGDIVFVATVVQSYSIFWKDIRSVVLRPSLGMQADQPPVPSNISLLCDERELKALPEGRPHVAILCDANDQCPCGWICCPSCAKERCEGHAICRQPAETEKYSGKPDAEDSSEEEEVVLPTRRPSGYGSRPRGW